MTHSMTIPGGLAVMREGPLDGEGGGTEVGHCQFALPCGTFAA